LAIRLGTHQAADVAADPVGGLVEFDLWHNPTPDSVASRQQV
jgi:hypothetical protein